MAENRSEDTLKEVAKRLVGKELTLSPSAAFFYDPNEQFVLTAYGKQERKTEFNDNTVIVKEEWKVRPVMKSIAAGTLRVLDPKSKKDISVEFGGPERPFGRNKGKPLVTSPRPSDPEDTRDKKLKDLLRNTEVDKVVKNLSSQNLTYEALERLLELEIQGENPAFQPRGYVVDSIKDIMKNTSGIGRAGKIKDEGKTEVTHK